jgi:hypothetical protein
MTDPVRRSWLTAKAWRVWARVKKEFRQMVRDPSGIAMGVRR